MAYSKIKLGAELLILLEEEASVEIIAKWADDVLFKNISSLDDFSENSLKSLSSMTLGEEFVYTREYLFEFAKNLINGKNIISIDDFSKITE